MMPSVGRIVHYVDPLTLKCVAAIVTEVADGDSIITDANLSVYLTQFFPGSTPRTVEGWVQYDSGNDLEGSWHWPERV